MKPIKWEKVKLKAQQQAQVTHLDDTCICAICEHIFENKSHWRKGVFDIQERVWNIISKWDIRCVRKLHELFPTCLPKDCKYAIELQNDGDWWVVA